MAAVRDRLRDPVLWGNAFLLVKAAGAAVLAWVVARSVLGLAQPFLAPWAALLTVHATVYRTSRAARSRSLRVPRRAARLRRRRGVRGQRGVPRGRAAGGAMAVGTTRALRDESTTAATTALVVLLAGYSADTGMVGTRLLDTLIGIAVGLLVNLLVWPPLRDRTAARQVDVIDDRLGALLCDIAPRHARGARGAGGGAVGRAHARARPGHLRRLGRPAPGARERAPEPAPRGGGAGRRLARASCRCSRGSSRRWPTRAAWRGRSPRRVERRLGPRLPREVDRPRRARGHRGQRGRRRGHHAACARTSSPPRASGSRAVQAPRRGRSQGALLVNLRNILEAMDAVAEAQPVRVEARPAAALGRRRKSLA